MGWVVVVVVVELDAKEVLMYLVDTNLFQKDPLNLSKSLEASHLTVSRPPTR